MNILPLVLVALIAAFVGLLELDWARFFADPARELFHEVVDEFRGRRDLEAVVEVVGLGSVPVTFALQALLQEGVVRVEFRAPEELAGHIFTYRQGILVHYRPFGGGVRFVRVFPRDERLPGLELDPGRVELSLEEEVLGAGWDRFPRSSLTLPGFAGSPPPPEGPARSAFPLPPLPGPLRLTISGLPEPLREVTVWLDRETRTVRRVTVALRTGRVNVRIEKLRFDTGISLHDILEIPPVRETIWYREAQSM
ncbi:hypothetical protein ACVNPS_07255 [Candidatus Bipolaricaulota sp. J31]